MIGVARIDVSPLSPESYYWYNHPVRACHPRVATKSSTLDPVVVLRHALLYGVLLGMLADYKNRSRSPSSHVGLLQLMNRLTKRLRSNWCSRNLVKYVYREEWRVFERGRQVTPIIDIIGSYMRVSFWYYVDSSCPHLIYPLLVPRVWYTHDFTKTHSCATFSVLIERAECELQANDACNLIYRRKKFNFIIIDKLFFTITF